MRVKSLPPRTISTTSTSMALKCRLCAGVVTSGKRYAASAKVRAMIRTKGEAGTGDIVEAVRHLRTVHEEIRSLQNVPSDELMTRARDLGAPYDLVAEVSHTGALPVPNFSAGGVATPADAALMMQLGAQAVFVGSGVFKSDNPERRARAIVDAVAYWDDPDKLVEISRGIGEPMTGINVSGMEDTERLARRGW